MATKGITGASLRPAKAAPKGGPGRRLSDALASRSDEYPTHQLAPNPRNPAQRMNDQLDELVASITQLGILQPVTLVTVGAWLTEFPEDAGHFGPEVEWVIVAGHRRFAAAIHAGLSSVPAVLRDDLGGRLDEILLHENLHRLDLTPLQEAFAFQRLIDHGLSQRTIAAQLGISQSQISKRLSLLILPEVALHALEDGTLAITEAQRLAKDEPAEVLDRVGQQWDGQRSTMFSAVYDARRAISAAKSQQKAEVASAEYGAPVVARRSLHSGAEWCGDDKAVKAAKKAGTLVIVPAEGSSHQLDGAEPDFYNNRVNEAKDTEKQKQDTEDRERRAASKRRRGALLSLAAQPPTPEVVKKAVYDAILANLSIAWAAVGARAFSIAKDIEFGPIGATDHYDWSEACAADTELAEQYIWLRVLAAWEESMPVHTSKWPQQVGTYYALLTEHAHYQPTPWETAHLEGDLS